MNMDKQHMNEVIEKSKSLFNLLQMIIPASTSLEVKVNATANLFCKTLIEMPLEHRIRVLAYVMLNLSSEENNTNNENDEED